MITLVEALNFRCLRYVRQPLDPFHVLIGPNASGKTTFIDVISFLGQLISEGLEAAIFERTGNFQDLIWNRGDAPLELAVEARIPEEKQKLLPEDYNTIRYEIKLGLDPENGGVSILQENALLINRSSERTAKSGLISSFPLKAKEPYTLIGSEKKNSRPMLSKAEDKHDYYYSEVYEIENFFGRGPHFQLGPHKLALSNLPADENSFPVAIWFRELLTQDIQQFVLNSLLIRKASPPLKRTGFRPDGSNLPWVIENLRAKSTERFTEWIEHLRTALPDLKNVKTIERADDKHRYLVIEYANGLEVPSWMASDGTLRLLALTLPAYIPDFKGIYLIEEPENGIHPRAVETLMQSLGSVYDAQILMATHSTVVLSIVEPERVLCFAKTPEGETDIVRGSEHPALRNWKGETDLGLLFAGGVLD